MPKTVFRKKRGQEKQEQQYNEGMPLTHPAAAVEASDCFTGSFQDRLILPSPINEGAFACNG